MSEEEIALKIFNGELSVPDLNKPIKDEWFKNIMKDYLDTKKENTQLKERVDMYENPKDLTLMFMYCDEKAKDKIKHLTSVLKEIREKLKEHKYDLDYESWSIYKIQGNILFDLVEIIDKAGIGCNNG